MIRLVEIIGVKWFYKILLDSENIKGWEMLTGEIDFIQKNKKNEFVKKIDFQPEGYSYCSISNQRDLSKIKIMNSPQAVVRKDYCLV